MDCTSHSCPNSSRQAMAHPSDFAEHLNTMEGRQCSSSSGSESEGSLCSAAVRQSSGSRLHTAQNTHLQHSTEALLPLSPHGCKDSHWKSCAHPTGCPVKMIPWDVTWLLRCTVKYIYTRTYTSYRYIFFSKYMCIGLGKKNQTTLL